MFQPDHQRAQRLLTLRREGPSFQWRYLLKSARLWTGVVLVLSTLVYVVLYDNGLWINRVVWFATGGLFGRLVRDWLWLRDVVDGFTFLNKVIDWTKVEELAGATNSDRDLC